MMEQSPEVVAGQNSDTATSIASPGRMLREARERLGLSVADAAGQIRLAPRQIDALEADDLERLPEMPFVRGFVRNYAKILHLDARPLLDALPKIKPAVAKLTPISVEVPFPNAHAPQLQNLIWLGATLLLAVGVVAFAVWHFTTPLTQPAVAPVNVPRPLPVEMKIIPASPVPETDVIASEVPPAPTAALIQDAAQSSVAAVKVLAPQALSGAQPVKPVTPTQTATPTPASALVSSRASALRLVFGDESWTEVRDKDGNLLSSQINARGSELRLDGSAPFTLAIGRAASVQLYHRGKQVDLKPYINSSSEVARLTLE